MRVAVIIPCGDVDSTDAVNQCKNILTRLGPAVHRVYILGPSSLESLREKEFRVHYVPSSSSIGASLLEGYKKAIEERMELILTILPHKNLSLMNMSPFLTPILSGETDLAIGAQLTYLSLPVGSKRIPFFRRNVSCLMCKFAHGYWNLSSKLIGVFAIHSSLLKLILPVLHEEGGRDIFFRLLSEARMMRAVVSEIIVPSNMDLSSPLVNELSLRQASSMSLRRVMFTYFFDNPGIGSIYLTFGLILFGLGAVGILLSLASSSSFAFSLFVLSCFSALLGGISFLSFLRFEWESIPSIPIHEDYKGKVYARTTNSEHDRAPIFTKLDKIL
jgi:hypothetical protein